MNPFESINHFIVRDGDDLHIDIQAIAETLVLGAKISEQQFSQGPGDYRASLHALIDKIWGQMQVTTGVPNQ